MLPGVVHCIPDKVYKKLIFIFFLGNAVSLFKTDIVFCPFAGKETEEHIRIALQIIRCEMVPGKEQVVQLDMIDLVSLKCSCHL